MLYRRRPSIELCLAALESIRNSPSKRVTGCIASFSTATADQEPADPKLDPYPRVLGIVTQCSTLGQYYVGVKAPDT
jgi:hypothetical protein